MSVIEIFELDELIKYSQENSNTLCIIDFSATWCGPCKRIAPYYESLSSEYPDVRFYKTDVDESSELCEHFSITSMPTFIFLKNNETVGSVLGANKKELKNTLDKLTTSF